MRRKALLALALALSVAAVAAQSASISVAPSATPAAGGVVHLIGFNATEPAWTATGGSWCMDETCTWRADAATVRTFGSHMHWISDTGGTFTVNLHSAGGATVLASQTITVSSGG